MSFHQITKKLSNILKKTSKTQFENAKTQFENVKTQFETAKTQITGDPLAWTGRAMRSKKALYGLCAYLI